MGTTIKQIRVNAALYRIETGIGIPLDDDPQVLAAAYRELEEQYQKLERAPVIIDRVRVRRPQYDAPRGHWISYANTLEGISKGRGQALADAAAEINCAGPIAHRIRVLRKEHERAILAWRGIFGSHEILPSLERCREMWNKLMGERRRLIDFRREVYKAYTPGEHYKPSELECLLRESRD